MGEAKNSFICLIKIAVREKRIAALRCFSELCREMWLTNPGRVLCGVVRKHPLFIGKTLMVENNDVATAMTRMNKLLSQDGVIQSIRRNKYYEKPFEKRQRLRYEYCKELYDKDMRLRIQFLMRANRKDPWVGN